MGDRALVQFRSKKGYSPAIYLHWRGGAVPDILARCQTRLQGQAGDVSYCAARFVQDATLNDDGALGFGIMNAEAILTEGDSHGDAGVIVVDCSRPVWTVECFGGYLKARGINLLLASSMLANGLPIDA